MNIKQLLVKKKKKPKTIQNNVLFTKIENKNL